MSSRHDWIAAFIGRVLRQGHSIDPDWVYDTADELYLEMFDIDPELAADSAFGSSGSPGRAGGTLRHWRPSGS